ncbi:MAG: cation-translocating P-type ATPase, partial [Saprospiraceae bacterium]
FVRQMTFIGILVFLMVWLISFLKNNDWLGGLLKGLTLAMSILPEEIPVAFVTFIALGSRRLVRDGILVKKTRVVETLGGATVICTDKTGTITENRMSLQCIYANQNKKLSNDLSNLDGPAKEVIEASMWSSEPIPFDPMEKTIHDAYEKNVVNDKRSAYAMIHEYPLGGKPPMMTHVFENLQKEQIIACKGAPEAILEVCTLQDVEKLSIRNIIGKLAGKGYRLLGVALGSDKLNEFPVTQQEIRFQFMGLLAFYDPPKKNIREVFNSFYTAGVNIKIITGDNALTTRAIAESAGLKDAENVVDGDELMKMSESQLNDCVRNTNIFTRMFPEAKLAVINAIKANHQIVAMVGDGVNDGPALKAADIGIAMGHKGTELAKNAADLILLEDDLAKMIVAIAAGRRIYSNLKKAVQYIISIHIPIIATVSLPLFLGWIYPNIFTPVHVIFLELVMGPTCSIVFENEPLEKNAMQRPPRLWTSSFLNWKEMTISIFQGIMISIGVLLIYQYAVHSGADEDMTRTMVFITLVMANIFLTLVNRSFYYSILSNLKNKNPLLFAVISVTIIMLIAMVYVPAFRIFFHLAVPPIPDILICITTAIISVLWIEIWKWNKRKTK